MSTYLITKLPIYRLAAASSVVAFISSKLMLTRGSGLTLPVLAIPFLLLASFSVAAVTFIDSSTSTINSNSISVNVPAATIAGDFLLTQISVRGGSGVTITAPSGWTLLNRQNALDPGSGATLAQAIYQRFATAAEPPTYTWNFSSSERAAALMLAYRNVSTVTPVGVIGGQANADSTSITAPSITTTVANTVLVAFFGIAQGNAAITAPAVMTARTAINTSAGPNGTSIATSDELFTAPGPTGTRVASSTNSAVNIGQLLALRPGLSINHIRIQHDGEGLTCTPEQVTVRACLDANCTAESSSSVTTTLSPTGWVGGDTITFTGNTTVQLRRTTVSSVTLSSGSTSPTPATATRCFNGATETCSLNFVDSGFIFDVPNLTACKTSATVTISAVKSTDSGTSCAPAFSGARTVNFWSSYSNPPTGTRAVSVNGTAVGTSSPGTGINLTFNAAAQTTITANYPDAGQMQLNARYTGSGSEAGLVMNGTDSFVSIPVGLAVYAASSCAAGDATCPVFGTAGIAFGLTAKAACWVFDGDTDLSDNPATPNFRLAGIPMTHSLMSPGGGQPGTLAISTFDFIAADNGIHPINQSVSEVGVFRFSATPAASTYFGQTVAAGTSPNIGRFKPNHFALSAGMLTHRVNMSCLPASTFTYMGENLRLEFTLTAQNSSNATTQNYTGSFAKLNPAIIGNYNIGAIDSIAPTPLSGRIALQSASGAWTNGNVNVFAVIALNRSAGIDGPYTNLALGIDPIDSDSVRLVSYNLDVDNNASNDHGLVANASIHFGRMRLENIFGTELLPLALPLYTEYYNGSQFIRNTTDSCSTYNAASITYSNRQGLSANPIANGNGILFGGNFDPSNPITFNSSSQVGNIDATLNVPAWLQFDWDNNSIHNNNPIAHITFGIYNGSNRQIYSREVY